MSTTHNTITIDPLTRIEGHLKIKATVDGHKVVDARSEGTLYRGFEQILIGREPLDAVQITQRFCGVCPTPHAIASSQALDDAFGIMPPDNGRVIRNIMQGANSIQSHILHFYHLASLDYFQGPEIPPFIPRYEADYRVPKTVQKTLTDHYIQAYQIRLKAHELCAIWSGKMPHMASIIAGGVTIRPRIDNITTSLWRLKELSDFIDNVYLPDVLMLAQIYREYLHIGSSCGNMIAFGQFDLDSEPDVTKRKRMFPMGRIVNGELKKVDPQKIREDLKYSKYQSSDSDYPGNSITQPEPTKPNAYSWLKSPRYDGKAYEVGPLARIKVAYVSQTNPKVNQLVDESLNNLQVGPEALCSVMGRHLARALECKIIADAISDMILEVKLDAEVCTPHEIPNSAEGVGLWGAARGALGHWIEIKDKKIARYQAVAPTTWNASPKDNKDQPGPIEYALIGSEVEDLENPFVLARIVRSFDPCIACAVHLLRPGVSAKEFRVV